MKSDDQQTTSRQESPTPCTRAGRFDEALLSGFMDGELTQGDEQRVRLHLEECTACHAIFEDLARVRTLAGGSIFRQPEDDQWDERPRGTASRLSLRLGWVLLVLFVVAVAVLQGYFLLSADGPLWSKLLLVAGGGGAALLLLSVWRDRLAVLPNDRYLNVKK